ncbi:preprotein translocase, SecG subunit [Desulfatibacillum aliphaticivorans]|uniref:Protein-export membrane protein SecG n=2 Tax=Desulfatibacillum aliphaticivorans TaxID=218208 RepID=B8F9V8_DESAL|nr:preprotein translocase, SecG subunit [Desulfatibacillum aliphaticivorans]
MAEKEIMTILVTVIHIVVCIALILIVLLQTGKGADMGAAFGGGSSQTVFGSSGPAGFLSKGTTVAAVLFMCTSLFLAIPSDSAMERRAVAPEPITQEEMDQAMPTDVVVDDLKAEADAAAQAAEEAAPASEAAAATAEEAPAAPAAEATPAPAAE